MKYTKKHIAKLLHETPNITASVAEIIQFLHSTFYNPLEDDEGNICEDFLSFSKRLDADLLESKDFSIDKTFLSGSVGEWPKGIPKKVLKQIEEAHKQFEEDFDEFVFE